MPSDSSFRILVKNHGRTPLVDIKAALKGQYHAQLAMLRECIELCPNDAWALIYGGEPRTYWRIVYHALHYTHLYLMQTLEQFAEWPKAVWHGRVLWTDDEQGMPPAETTYSQSDLIEYLEFVDSHVDAWVDALDLESQESGFYWYKIPKIDHQLVNIRHLGLHIGQCQEHLYALGLEPSWISKR